MTEEETFKVLAKQPFDIIRQAMNKWHMDNGFSGVASKAGLEIVCKENHWTIDEWINEIIDRNAANGFVDLEEMEIVE